MSQPPTSRVRLIAAASLLGSAAAVVAITGVGPVPSVFQLSSASRNAPADVSPLVTSGSSLTSDASPGDTTVDDQGQDQPSSTVAGQSTTSVDDNGPEVSDDNTTEVSDDNATEVDSTDTEVDDSTDTTVDDSTDTTVEDTSTADTSGHDGSSSDTSGSGHD